MVNLLKYDFINFHENVDKIEIHNRLDLSVRIQYSMNFIGSCIFVRLHFISGALSATTLLIVCTGGNFIENRVFAVYIKQHKVYGF